MIAFSTPVKEAKMEGRLCITQGDGIKAIGFED